MLVLLARKSDEFIDAAETGRRPHRYAQAHFRTHRFVETPGFLGDPVHDVSKEKKVGTTV